MDVVQVNIKNDDSVQKLIDKTAHKLQSKYSKKRVVNEKILKHRKRWMDVLSKILSVVCVVVVAFSALLFVGILNSLLQGVPSSFAGFTSMKVGSGSMVASGFNIGDNAIAKSVNTKTLKEGNIIAFYNDPSVSTTFNVDNSQDVDTTNMGEPEYQITFAKFFGTQNDAIRKAANANRSIIFHEIIDVRELDGTRWFKTKGSSNNSEDSWYVREDLVVGVYDDSFTAKCIASVLQTFSSSQGVILAIVIPLALIGVVVLLQFMRDIQILKLQLDVVEEKRKINDPICTKYEVGYKMDNKMKYKVLAQADDKDKNEYISLLWKDGKAPENIRKYCLRKKMYLKPVERLLEINRICQERLKNGEDPNEVAKFYLKEKSALQEEQLAYERKFRKWVKEDKINWVSDEELEYDDEADSLNIKDKKASKDAKKDEQIVVEIDENNQNLATDNQESNAKLDKNETSMVFVDEKSKTKPKAEKSKIEKKKKEAPKNAKKIDVKDAKKKTSKPSKIENKKVEILATAKQETSEQKAGNEGVETQKTKKQVAEKLNAGEKKSTKEIVDKAETPKAKISKAKTSNKKTSKEKASNTITSKSKTSKPKVEKEKSNDKQVKKQSLSNSKSKKQETKEQKAKNEEIDK